VFKLRQGIGIVCGIFIGFGLGLVLETRAAPRRDGVPDVVQARQFQVVDRDGTVRMKFGLEADGVSRLSLSSPNKKEVIVAQVTSRGDASFSLRDREEQERASLSVSEEKGTVLALTGAGASLPIAALAVLPDGSEALSLTYMRRGEDGKPLRTGTATYTSADGKTELRYYNKSGKLHTITP
jgi:hypothetical protein